jgi:hypothetical protein
MSSLAFMSALTMSQFAGLAHAATIKISDPAADYSDSKNPDPRATKPGYKASIASYLDSKTAANSGAPIFTKAWDAWNTAQTNKWTLKNGGKLEGEFDVTKFDTWIDGAGKGGVTFRMNFTPKGKDPVKWVWSQGLDDNYDGIAPPWTGPAGKQRYEMDVKAGATNPGYPHTYADQHFFDAPGAYTVQDSTVFFHAVVLLVAIDDTNRTMTTYEGISYGWDLTSVPTPGSLALMGVGGMLMGRRRRS